MLHLLTSLLLLGTSPQSSVATTRPLPGAEILSVHSPAVVRNMPSLSLTASGAMLVDVTSGEVLYAKNPDIARPMASLTKIMTALLLIENHDLNETVTIPPVAQSIQGSSIDLRTGMQFKLEDLLTAMMLPSANDVAYSLAVHHGKTVKQFVAMMNDRARSLGLTKTHFSNPAGLDDVNQYATPRDLAWLTLAALRKPEFQTLVSTKEAKVENKEGASFLLRNTNEILHSQPNVFGVKTGTTDNARECLIVLFTQNRRSYALVLLGSKDRYTDALQVMKEVSKNLSAS
ncbi:MAG: D-alanyl-D-alanine carboxypeptidase [Candidatus Peribacteraceae bacterium]|nr:D-alanyl-D-alanine carboxypeptidase [Candidatus Peribacteraceae bacterium]